MPMLKFDYPITTQTTPRNIIFWRLLVLKLNIYLFVLPCDTILLPVADGGSLMLSVKGFDGAALLILQIMTLF